MKATTLDFAAGNLSSAPESPDERLLAMLVDQLDVHPGHRILHIGPGHLTNLLAERAGPDGGVTTAISVEDAGDHRRYDRIVITAECWDPLPAWCQRLAATGRLVMLLRLRGATHCIVFEAAGTRSGFLRSVSSRFVRATSADFVDPHGRRRPYGARSEILTVADERPVLVWEAGQGINPADLRRSLQFNTGNQRWTGITIREDEDLGTLWLWLASKEFGACGLAGGTGNAIAPMAIPGGTPAVVDDANFAYLTRREERFEGLGPAEFELGVAAFGPYADMLGKRFATHICKWRASRRPPSVTVSHRPSSNVKTKTSGIDRPGARIEVSC